MSADANSLLQQVRACTLCSADLAHGVRPVLQADPAAKILIAGQAPGRKVHASGVPFDDASGERLRDWMGVNCATFYNPEHIAILPMAFCYPGQAKSGDLPPMPICAETWRQPLLDLMPNNQLILLVGQYAQAWHLPERQKNLTETVKNWRSYPAHLLPLPHPSPRNNIWLKKNPWFSQQVLPYLKEKVANALP